MALTANDIIARAGYTLNDYAGVRWTPAELLIYITDGMRRVCGAIPSAYAITGAVTLQVSGSGNMWGTKQPLPTTIIAAVGGGTSVSGQTITANRIIDVIRNLDSSRSPLAVIRPIARGVLDANDISWHTRTGPLVQHYYYDPDHDNAIWWAYPGPAAAGQQVEMTVAVDPPAVVSSNPTGNQIVATAILPIDALYHESLIDYVIARAVTKDAEETGNNNLQRAQFHASGFYTAIGQDKGAPIQ